MATKTIGLEAAIESVKSSAALEEARSTFNFKTLKERKDQLEQLQSAINEGLKALAVCARDMAKDAGIGSLFEVKISGGAKASGGSGGKRGRRGSTAPIVLSLLQEAGEGGMNLSELKDAAEAKGLNPLTVGQFIATKAKSEGWAEAVSRGTYAITDSGRDYLKNGDSAAKPTEKATAAKATGTVEKLPKGATAKPSKPSKAKGSITKGNENSPKGSKGKAPKSRIRVKAD